MTPADSRGIWIGRARSALTGLERTFRSLFHYRAGGWQGRIQGLLLAAMYLAGAVLWWYFLNGGAIRFDLHDWVEAGHRYTFLKDAVTTGRLPLHMPGDWALRGVTLRFVNVVDTNLSPQILLLRFLEIGPFVLFNTLLLYSAGFAGLVLLRRRFQLSPVITAVLFLMLFFNGHVISHIAVGHVHWAAHLLAPFVILSATAALRPHLGAPWVAGTALLLFVIFLQGGYHLFVIAALFMGLLAFVRPEHFGRIWLALLLAGLLSAVRILPALLDVQKFDTGFFTGFPASLDLLEGLAVLKTPQAGNLYSHLPSNPLGWWEFDYYLGLAGAAAVLFFIALPANSTRISARPLLVPLAAMTVLSVGRIYTLVHALGIPVLATQRVSARLFFIPFCMAIAVAAVKAQAVLDGKEKARWHYAAGIGLLLLIANDVWQHLKAWRVVNMERLFEPTVVDLSRNVVVDRVDPPYETLVVIGAAISVVTLLAIAWMLLKAPDAKSHRGR